MSNYSRKNQNYVVRVNGTIDPTYQVLRMQESVGAKRLDFAVLMRDPKTAPAIQDYSITAGFDSEIEIVAVDGAGLPVLSNPVKHWGRISQISPLLGQAGEQWRIVSRAEPFHFGFPLSGYWIRNPLTSSNAFIDFDIVFNPQIDGTVYGNRNPGFVLDPTSQASVFIDPESARTPSARSLQGVTPAIWTLADAIYYLCWSLNGNEVNIKNPTINNLDAIFGTSAYDIRDTRLRRGIHLPEALDQLLDPLGFIWRMSKQVGSRGFEFVRTGTGGNAVYVNHQRMKQDFDPSQTNVKSSGVVFNGAGVVNRIIAVGSPIEVEITAELVRAWPESQDDSESAALQKSHDNFASVRNAYRKWVLNEAGDYIGLRPEISGAFTPQIVSDLSDEGMSGLFSPRRRKLLPTLTQDSAGTEPIGNVRGVRVEYLDWDGSNWLPIENWSCKVLQKEAGIYFDGDRVPEQILDQRDNASVRVTATIVADIAVASVFTGNVSPLGQLSAAALNMDGQFQRRLVASFSQYSGSGRPSLAVDDSAELSNFTGRLIDIWDRVEVSGAIALEGVDQHGYLPADRVLGIQHRNVSFEARVGSGAYPQIVGITYDIVNQQTILELQRFREIVV